MLNYSEFHPRTGDLLAKLIADVFPEEEVAFIHGDLETAQAFGQLRFDHLFFTGSPKVGSIVSAEAGKNLVPVTMELGGRIRSSSRKTRTFALHGAEPPGRNAHAQLGPDLPLPGLCLRAEQSGSKASWTRWKTIA
jgi:hypothetical protein